MNKIFTILAIIGLFFVTQTFATDFTISISALTYSPDDLTVEVGDNITISAVSSHPTAQVSEATWNANGTTELAGGWGTKSVSFSITPTEVGTLYYVCTNHVGNGMKGKINVMAPTGIKESLNKIYFQLGPNPFFGTNLTYKIGSTDFSSGVIDIYNEAGQSVHVSNLDARNGSIELTVESGLYIYVIRNKAAEVLATGQLVVIE